jgi:pilus assembly protein Flp/PilA
MQKNILKRLIEDESGATAVEYGLIVALVSVAAITAYTTLGTNISGMFTGISDKIVAP